MCCVSLRTLGGVSERPFSPTNLIERDMQTLWLQILGRFTSAAYTSEPLTTIQLSSPSLSSSLPFFNPFYPSNCSLLPKTMFVCLQYDMEQTAREELFSPLSSPQLVLPLATNHEQLSTVITLYT